MVMSIKRRVEELVSLVSAFTAQVPPLGDSDLAVVRRAMAEIAPDWAVELSTLSDEDTTLIVVPDDGDDSTGPSFVVSRETYGLRIDQLHWDAVTEVGVFASMKDVVQVLRARLAFCLDATVPPSVTLH
jgi:hypothetical protein